MLSSVFFINLVSSDITSLLVVFGAFPSWYWFPSADKIFGDFGCPIIFYLRIGLPVCSVNHSLSSGTVKEGHNMLSRESESSLLLLAVSVYLGSAPLVPGSLLTLSHRQTFGT